MGAPLQQLAKALRRRWDRHSGRAWASGWGAVLALALATALVGCEYDVWSFDDCELDPESCVQTDEGWKTYSCAIQEPLQIELGEGDLAFLPLAAGSLPQPHLATGFQGGGSAHVFGGVRIKNPDPVHRRFRLEFTTCSGDVEGDASAGERASSTCKAYLRTRLAVVGQSMAQSADGSLSRAGIQVFLQGELHWIALQVQDECGRTATDGRP